MPKISDQIKSKNSVRNNNDISALTRGYDKRQKNNKPTNDGFRRSPVLIDDGGDHINVWSYGQTDLGKALAFDTDIWVDLPGLGVFRSIFSLWTFLTTKRRVNSLRKASTKILRGHVSVRYEDDNYEDYPNVRYICGVAILDHILRNKVLAKALIASGEAPLTSYIEKFDGTQYEHPQAAWWIPTLRLIRATLLSGDPVTNKILDVLKDNKQTDEQIFVPLPEYSAPRLGVIDFESDVGSLDDVLKKPTTPKGKADKPQREPSKEYQELRDSLKVNPDHHFHLIGFYTEKERKDFLTTVILKKINGESMSVTELKEHGLKSDLPKGMFPVYLTTEAVADDSPTVTVVSIATSSFANPYAAKPVESLKVNSVRDMVMDVLYDHVPRYACDLFSEPQFDKVREELTDILFPVRYVGASEAAAS